MTGLDSRSVQQWTGFTHSPIGRSGEHRTSSIPVRPLYFFLLTSLVSNVLSNVVDSQPVQQ